MIFVCKVCRTPLSYELHQTDADASPTAQTEGAPEAPAQGTFVIGPAFSFEPERYSGMATFYTMNLSDLVNTVQDPKRTIGCCGSDGLRGLNLQCANHHTVGVEFSDCWQDYHCALLVPDLVELAD